nr:hypothetical protein [Phycisphaerae bacterium]NIU07403.1 hypothetical protein [Phycisphaerae bacterium]NIW96823.1 hypothetical protein [Phycisphaerae bacterium]NIX27340.1 hypothetical protein [Phycisphaerae bacterium]
MVSKRILLSLFLFIITSFVTRLSAQDTTNFFPHHLGDMWEYYVIGDNLFDTLQVIVVSDSVGQDSFSYFQHHRQFVNPTQPPPFGWWEDFKQDTLGQIFASGGGSIDRLQ